MHRLLSYVALLFFVLSITSSNVLADNRTLTADEIKELLSGNTAVGRWIDHNYRQYFGADGTTIYAQEGTRSSTGRWRVNRKRNHYESWWEQSDWGAGFTIALMDGVYYWVSSTGTTEPQSFRVVAGQQLVFGQ
jgi:hypothetical protein